MNLFDAAFWSRFQFGFTLTYHYLFPQLTMGLALLLVVMKGIALRTGDRRYDEAARFWGRIFGINFAFGVVTGIPMEFQFGTNWAAFSKFAGGVIGQTLAMEGMFAFFLESSFLGLFLYGERRLGRVGHWVSSLLVFLGSWLSGYFIVATDAWMQHPVAYTTLPDGSVQLSSFRALLTNPWALWQYAHTMSGAAITGAVVMAGVGAFYLLTGRAVEHGRLFLKVGVIAGCLFSLLQLFPTGDGQGRLIAEHQPTTLAAMEALFNTAPGAPLVLIGQPNMAERQLDNPILVPGVLSFLTYRRWGATVQGLDAFPPSSWPDNIPLLYYAYHIMVGLGTIMLAVLLVAVFLLWRGALARTRWMLWLLMLLIPFPYIANTAGWMTAEIGRQPWVVYGLMRTAQGFSPEVSAGNGLFTLLGFMGMYTVLTVVFLFLVRREIEHGPAAASTAAAH
ncbi:MAG: cytochrome ubiquinol oxidase subunit I [Acidobacteriota bacterium]|nr:cytochrome ubiquinol oxidase subunit I [Acidobacteriota bacterium]